MQQEVVRDVRNQMDGRLTGHARSRAKHSYGEHKRRKMTAERLTADWCRGELRSCSEGDHTSVTRLGVRRSLEAHVYAH